MIIDCPLSVAKFLLESGKITKEEYIKCALSEKPYWPKSINNQLNLNNVMGKDPKKKDEINEQVPAGPTKPDPKKEAPVENQTQAIPQPEKDASQNENFEAKEERSDKEFKSEALNSPQPPLESRDPNFYISLHFTLKGQKFKNIQKWLHHISDKMDKDCIIVHAFMTRAAVAKKGFSSQVVDILDTLFPNQKNFFNEETGLPDREAMVDFLKDKKSTSFFIGSITEGVLEEYELFKSVIQDQERIITLGSIDGETTSETE